MTHEHSTLFLGYLVRDHEIASLPHDPDIATPGKVYWCQECGTVFGVFSHVEGTLIAEWARDKLATMTAITRKVIERPDPVKLLKPSRSSKRLGRGLSDMPTQLSGGGLLYTLFKNTDKGKD